MKILYLIPNHNMNNKCCGVTKKIIFQKEAFYNIGFKGEMIYYDNETLYIEDINTGVKSSVLSESIERKKQSTLYKYLLDNYIIDNIDLVYIRYPRARKELINLLKNLKKIKPNIKIFIEIVTYPYDNEEIYSLLNYKSTFRNKFSGSFRILEDRINRKKLKKYVDKIVTFSEDDLIFGINTIKTSNGISSKLIGYKKNIKKGNKINIIGVGGIAKHHGYDRVLLGLSDYNKNKSLEHPSVYFHIVGDGVEIKNLKYICQKYNLNTNVIFHGYKNGDELERIYNESNIAIGSIGRHRNNIYQLADLKSREYCAKGIPFVKTVKDLDFEQCNFCLTIEANDKPINILEIINFYTKIELDEGYKEKMLEYARNNLTWESKLLPIAKEIMDIGGEYE